MPPRITLATLMGFVAVLALGMAGMLSASRLWLTVAATITLVILLGAGLKTWLSPSSIDRTFWVGFSVFAWTYLLLVNWDWLGGQFGHDLTAGISEAAEWLFPEIPSPPYGAPAPAANPFAPPPAGVISFNSDPTGSNFMVLSRQRQIKVGNFVQIGRMLGALFFGMLGGWLARSLAERRDRRGSPG